MHFFKTLLAGAALVAATVAHEPLAFTSFPDDVVVVGTPVFLTWEGGDPTEPVTITLRRGPSENLEDVAVLTSSATGGSYTWTPSENLVDGDDYALMISQGDETNYTGQFSISGGSGTTESATTDATSITVTLTSVSPSTTEAPITTSDATPTITSSASRGFTSTVSSQNSTVVRPTLTSTRIVTLTPTPTQPAETTPATPEPSNAASSIGVSSPLALVLGAFAAFAYLN